MPKDEILRRINEAHDMGVAELMSVQYRELLAELQKTTGKAGI